MNKNVSMPPGDGQADQPSDFGKLDEIKPADLARDVRDVLAGNRRLSEVSPLVKSVLQRMRSKQ